MGDDPQHTPGPGGVPTQGSLMYHWEASPEVIESDMELSSSVFGNAGGGF